MRREQQTISTVQSLIGVLTQPPRLDMTCNQQPILLTLPYAEEPTSRNAAAAKVSKAKEFIASDHGTIELHDLLIAEVRHFLASTANDSFSLSDSFSLEELTRRLDRYEAATMPLALPLACVAYWGLEQHQSITQKCLARATDGLDVAAGLTTWIAFRWYPIVLLIYTAGIAAVDTGRYENLVAIFQTPVAAAEFRGTSVLADAASHGLLEIVRHEIFKRLPGHDRQHVPLSEYLFKNLQPSLDDTFFLGRGYEPSFDRFEVLLCLSAMDLRLQRGGSAWGPIGRFYWKARHDQGPAARLIAEARAQKDGWAPIRAGLFGQSFERFEMAAKELEGHLARAPF